VSDFANPEHILCVVEQALRVIRITAGKFSVLAIASR